LAATLIDTMGGHKWVPQNRGLNVCTSGYGCTTAVYYDGLIELTNPLRVNSRAIERPKAVNVCTLDIIKLKTTKNSFARLLLRALRLP